MSVCFAILSHEQPEGLEDLLANLRYFCPKCTPLVYNSSGSNNLFRRISAPVYPRSRRLAYGLGTEYIFDLMEWSISEGHPFDYFVVLDNDMLFINQGFEAFLDRKLQSSEYLGVEFHTEPSPEYRWCPSTHRGDSSWQPIQLMWPEWHFWQPLLGVDHPFGAFNAAQTFRRSLVERILSHPRIHEIRKATSESTIVGLAEILFPTMAAALNGNPQAYPRDPYARAVQSQFTHWGKESLSVSEVQHLQREPDCFFVHPVRPLTPDQPVREFVRTGKYDPPSPLESTRHKARRSKDSVKRGSGGDGEVGGVSDPSSDAPTAKSSGANAEMIKEARRIAELAARIPEDMAIVQIGPSRELRSIVERQRPVHQFTPDPMETISLAQPWTRPIGLLMIEGEQRYEGTKAHFQAWAQHIPTKGRLVIIYLDKKARRAAKTVVKELIRPSGLWVDKKLHRRFFSAVRR